MKTARWVGLNHDTGWHVLPLNDEWDHEPEDCTCGPTQELVECDDGDTEWLITHHSLDGREHHE